MTGENAAYVARAWDLGEPQEVMRRRGGMTLDVVTPTGHIVQVSVDLGGYVSVRAWMRDDLYDNGGDNRTAFTASGRLEESSQKPDPGASS